MIHYANGKLVAGSVKPFSNGIYVHKICIDWTPQVYYEGDYIINLESELSRASKLKCSTCGLHSTCWTWLLHEVLQEKLSCTLCNKNIRLQMGCCKSIKLLEHLLYSQLHCCNIDYRIYSSLYLIRIFCVFIG